MARWIIAVSVVVIAMATLLPGPASSDAGAFCIFCGPFAGVDVVLNVLLFVPLGFGLALSRIRAAIALAVMCGGSIAIEALQVVAITGRDANLGDILSNSVGGALGFLAGRRIQRLLRPQPEAATGLLCMWLSLWLGLQIMTAYALVPTLPEPPYFGQIARPTGPASEVLRGRVLAVAVGAELVVRWRLPNASTVRGLLERRDGALVTIHLIGGGASTGIVEIVRLSGPDGRDVLSFEQLGEDIDFRVRTGADVLRLRPFVFRLHDVFDTRRGSPTTDTLRLDGRYGRQKVSIAATSHNRASERQFVPRLSNGWRLFAPVQTEIDGGPYEQLVSAVYFALLTLPVGFWLRHTIGAGGGSLYPRGMLTLSVGCFAVASVLAAVPAAFGLRPAAAWEWGAALTACGVGYLLAARTGRGTPLRELPPERGRPH